MRKKAMKRKRREHANHERWLVSYADFITLLFAFFVVLYSSSQVDKRKAGRLAIAIQVAFQELGVFQNVHPQSKGTVPVTVAVDQGQSIIQVPQDVPGNPAIKPPLDMPTEEQSLNDARALIEQALGPEIQRNEVSMSQRREGLVISLKEIGFFDSGSATVRTEALGAIARLADVLRQRLEELRIEGHTDNVPIHTVKFASNWELSTSRATEMITLLIGKFGLSPERLSAAGYAQFHPAASNDTAAGRAQNRRLDIVILAPPASR
jgi:chemotaxis protein MotB